MKITMITQWYDPEAGSAAVPGSIARALHARGHDVSVVTGFPNYPHGRIFDGYSQRLHQKETLAGVTVHRLPVYPSHDGSGARRALTYLVFMISSSSIGAFLARRSDALLVYSTSATVGISGVVARLIFRRKYVLYVEDLWPDSVFASGMIPSKVERPARWAINLMCSLGYRLASRIAVISPGMKEILVERGVPATKIDVIYNWIDEDIFSPVMASRPKRSTFDLMYAGSMGDVQGLDVAIEAIERLGDVPVRLRLVGGGVAEPALQKLATDLGVSDRVTFEGSMPIEEMSEVLASADAQLVCLRDIPLFHATMPSKTQAILACGLPIIVSAPGDVARLVHAAGAGFAATPGDPQSLADEVRRMLGLSGDQRRALGESGRRFYEQELASRVGSKRLETALEYAASGMLPS